MNEQTKRKMIRNYFRPFFFGCVILITIVCIVIFIISLPMVICVLIMLFGLICNEYERNNGVFALVLFSLFCLFCLSLICGGAFVLIRNYRKSKPTDQQMDQWLEEDIKGFVSKSLAKLGTDESELVTESLSVTGPRLWNVPVSTEILFRKGKDNVIRFTPIDVTTIHFTQNQLLIYNCILDFTKGAAFNEGTEEYFYKDVVSVCTKSNNMKVNSPKLGQIEFNAAETFTLNTSGGTSVSIILRDPQLIKRLGGGDIPITQAEKAIQSIRKMLRDKKT